MVGGGPMRPDLEQPNGLPVRFLGQLPAAEARAQTAGAPAGVAFGVVRGVPDGGSGGLRNWHAGRSFQLGATPYWADRKKRLVFEAANPVNLLDVVCNA